MESAQPISQQYRDLIAGPAWVDRSYRALIEVTGKDRVAWAHNLTTNQVKTLGRNEGNYAFALNVQGRILFDLNLVVRAESIWIDLDRRFLQTALTHFDKYVIMEDVRLTDRSRDFVRAAWAGEKTKSLLGDFGLSPAMASLSLANLCIQEADILVLRSDFCGEFAVDLFVPASVAAGFASAVKSKTSVVEVENEAVQVRRIEASIPWPGAEITDDVVPAETRQVERAVSFQKGCYLGQEIVERMRARKVVARMLSGLKIAGDTVPPPGSQVLAGDGAVVGTVTSACRSVALRVPVALGYVKTGSAAPGTALQVRTNGQTLSATVSALPFVPSIPS